MPKTPKIIKKKKPAKIPKLEFQKVFQYEAAEIIAAYHKAQIIYKTVDIDTAGDEVELTVRNIIRRRLPQSYYVSQGHVVNSNFEASGQFDIIIADNSVSPILFKALDGTEYFPHESIYAIGEVKTSYRGRKDWDDFIKKIEFVRELRTTNKVANTFITHSFDLGPTVEVSTSWAYRNPLFTFMLIVNSDNATVKKIAADLKPLYSSTPKELLPNIVCILDKGVMVFMEMLLTETGFDMGNLHHLPEFVNNDKLNKWLLIPYGDELHREGGNLSVLFFSLLEFLRSALLQPPHFLDYAKRVARPDPTVRINVEYLD